MLQATGGEEVVKEGGVRPTTKEEWPKEQETRITPVSTMDK